MYIIVLRLKFLKQKQDLSNYCISTATENSIINDNKSLRSALKLDRQQRLDIILYHKNYQPKNTSMVVVQNSGKTKIK
jgi:hypothetical protein